MRTITTKLTRIYLVVAVLVLLSFGLISQLYLYYHARTVAHENLRTLVVALASNLESAVAFNDALYAQQTLNALQHYPEVSHAAVFLSDGNYFAKYTKGSGANDQASLREDLTRGDFMTVRQHGVVHPIAQQMGAPARLLLVARLEDLNRESLFILAASTGVGAFILFAAFTLFQRMSRSITAPIENLTALVRKIERDGDHSQRAQIVSDDELGELALGFNAMLCALEKQNASLSSELVERKLAEEKLDRLAHYDSVTNLPNRHYFQERLRQSVSHSIESDKVMALLFVDLDNFKLVNDTFGHHIGDMQLHAVAERLSKSLRAGDVVCRLGGDEFAIILEYLPDTRQIDQICEKLMRNMTQPMQLDQHNIVVTGSIGVAVCPDDTETPESLLRFADSAMYAAKGAGRNTWRRFDSEMANQSTLRLTLESQIRIGMERHEFEVHYQPQIDMSTSQVCGLEALARWNHPERGYISPAQFIAVAEESGLIRPLGEWVLRTACRQAVAWSLEGHHHLKIAVNVSVRQLVQANFVAQVLAVLAETGCPAQQLELEVTESVLMQHSDKTRLMLGRLQDHGVGIVIDDFGTGYSSMTQLKNMPASKLKIDKSFVDDITTDRSDQAITAAITSLARNLGIRIIAEGVENSAQVAMLHEVGCHEFQGYHFSRPLPAAQVSAFITGFNRQHALEDKSKPMASSPLRRLISRWGDLK